MRQKTVPGKQPAEDVIRDIRRATRRHFSAEEKIRIVLEGLRGEDSIAEICRREGIAASMYYGWSKEFLEAGKKRLAGDTVRADVALGVAERERYVSRGGHKLEHGLAHFGVEVAGLRALDIGASTGGFTDCLLQRGALTVHAVDVGHGQLAWTLRQDPRVVVMERT